MPGLTDADRGQRLSRRLPAGLSGLARRYSDWNWSWRAGIALRYVPVEAALREAGWLNRNPVSTFEEAGGVAAHKKPAFLATEPRILDVGCGSKGGVTSYVPVRTTGLDLSFNVGRIRRHPAVTPLLGSGLALPLADASFDVALCMDTLEHLAPGQRQELVAELFRVVVDQGLVIAGAPCGLEARAAEERLNAAYRARTGREHPWLVEHLAHEPLTPETLRELLAGAAGRRFSRFRLELLPNTNLALWERLQQERWLRHVHRLIYEPLWPRLRQRHEPPVYRQVGIVWDQP